MRASTITVVKLKKNELSTCQNGKIYPLVNSKIIENDIQSWVVHLPHGLMWSTDPVFTQNDTGYDILEEFKSVKRVL